MLQIVGYVLIRETGMGVPNLVVTAFDSGGAPEILRKHAPTAQVMASLGRRIATVLTDQNGMFALSGDDLAFQGNEARPDLVVVVFGPEDIVDPDHPYPEPPEDRVLYLSLLPRLDAGAREAFVIRLARSVAGRLLADADENRILTSFQRAWRSRDTIAAGLNERHHQELERKAAAQREAIERTGNLNAVPVHLRKHKYLVTSKAALSKTVKDGNQEVTALQSLQHSAVHEGLRALAKSKTKPTMRLHLRKGDLQRLNLKLARGRIVGTTTDQKVQDLVLALNGGVDLVRKRGAENPGPDELERRYLSASHTRSPSSSRAHRKARKRPRRRRTARTRDKA